MTDAAPSTGLPQQPPSEALANNVKLKAPSTAVNVGAFDPEKGPEDEKSLPSGRRMFGFGFLIGFFLVCRPHPVSERCISRARIELLRKLPRFLTTLAFRRIASVSRSGCRWPFFYLPQLLLCLGSEDAGYKRP